MDLNAVILIWTGSSAPPTGSTFSPGRKLAGQLGLPFSEASTTAWASVAPRLNSFWPAALFLYPCPKAPCANKKIFVTGSCCAK